MWGVRASGGFIGRIMILAAWAWTAGCHSAAPPPPGPPDPVAPGPVNADWAQVIRRLDDSGLPHNDQRVITTTGDVARLRHYFPDLDTTAESPLHGGWAAWVLIRFHSAGGLDTWVSTDYRIYRINDGHRGDFVLTPGFADDVDRFFQRPPTTGP
jgi:hypothetical protein